MKTKRRKLPRLNWRPGDALATGSRQWFTRDGSFRLIASEVYDGIVLPRLWKLYVWKSGDWFKIAERRSRAAAEKIGRLRMAEWDAADEN